MIQADPIETPFVKMSAVTIPGASSSRYVILYRPEPSPISENVTLPSTMRGLAADAAKAPDNAANKKNRIFTEKPPYLNPPPESERKGDIRLLHFGWTDYGNTAEQSGFL